MGKNGCPRRKRGNKRIARRVVPRESIWNSRCRKFYQVFDPGSRVLRRRAGGGGRGMAVCDRELRRVASRMRLLRSDPLERIVFAALSLYVPRATRWIIVIHPRHDRRALLSPRDHVPGYQWNNFAGLQNVTSLQLAYTVACFADNRRRTWLEYVREREREMDNKILKNFNWYVYLCLFVSSLYFTYFTY